MPCAAHELRHVPLFSLLGNKFGGDETRTFGLPDFRTLAPRGLTYCIALEGIFPSTDYGTGNQTLGELSLATSDRALGENVACNGQLLPFWQYPTLAGLLGTRFGGDGKTTFGVPNLTTLAPKGSAYNIAATAHARALGTPFIGEVRLFSSTEIPTGWQACEGQSQPIRNNPELFSLIGTRFGGDQINFSIPNLQGIAPRGTQFCIATAGAYPRRK